MMNFCASGKKKCVDKKMVSLLKCHIKAEKTGLLDPLCLQKAYDKFDGGADPTKGCFAKLEAKYAALPCLTTGDMAALEAKVDAFVNDVVQELDPGYPPPTLNLCSSGKKKCVSNKAKGLLQCHEKCEKNILKCGATLDLCLAKVRTKFDGGTKGAAASCFGKLEAKYAALPCLTTGDMAALEAKVDAFVNDVICELDPSENTCPTPTAVPTVTATPTGVAPTPTPTPTPVLLVDHYELYNALGPPGPVVTLSDQFLNDIQPVGPLQFFLVPTNKNQEGILRPDQHLAGYPVLGSFAAMVDIDNQFGLQTISVLDSKFLAVPSQKIIGSDPGPIPLTIDHYRCYKADGPPLNRPVTVQDQFDPSPQPALVTLPEYFCNPVNKNGEGILNPMGHLTCYQIDHAVVLVPPVRVRNQFHAVPELVSIEPQPVALCVPTWKLSWH